MSLYLRQICVGVFVGPCPVLCCFAVLICGETQIWLGDLRVAFGFWWFCWCFVGVRFNDDLPFFTDHTCPCTRQLFTAYAIVRTEPSATLAIPEEKKKPFQCDLAPQRQETHRTTHTGTSIVAKHIEGTKQAQPQPPHRRSSFHHRLQPLYTEKHKVSCGVVFAGMVAMVAVVTSPTTGGCSVMYCNCSCSCSVVEL